MSLYCFNPRTLHMTKAEFAEVHAKPNALKRLEKDLLKEPKPGMAFMNFGTDPYNREDLKNQREDTNILF